MTTTFPLRAQLRHCLAVCAVAGILFVESSGQHRAEEPRSPPQREAARVKDEKNIDDFIQLKKLNEPEGKFVASRYSLKLMKPVPLRQLLDSDVVPRILAIGATIKFRILAADAAKEWGAKLGPSPPTVVSLSKDEFTFEDEIVFSIYFPSAAS